MGQLQGESYQLTWSDFKANPPKETDYAALTFPFLSYDRIGWDIKDGAFILKADFLVKITMKKDKSWVVQSEKSADLLSHEQGHYDMTVIGGKILLKKYNALTSKRFASKNALENELRSIYQDVSNAVGANDEAYDDETDHGLIAEKQKEWKALIARGMRSGRLPSAFQQQTPKAEKQSSSGNKQHTCTGPHCLHLSTPIDSPRLNRSALAP